MDSWKKWPAHGRDPHGQKFHRYEHAQAVALCRSNCRESSWVEPQSAARLGAVDVVGHRIEEHNVGRDHLEVQQVEEELHALDSLPNCRRSHSLATLGDKHQVADKMHLPSRMVRG